MRKLALLLAMLPSIVMAQNVTVPTRPFGDNTNAAASTAFVQSAFTNQKFVQCTNTTVDAAAINSAILAVGAAGPGIVWFAGPCNINTTINIGNGTSSSGSTTQGVILAGMGNPAGLLAFTGYSKPAGSTLTWTGSGSGGIVSINGPLQGWGLQNVYLDCNNVANSVGLNISSAQFGDVRNYAITNCTNKAIASNAVPIFGSFNETDSLHNNFYNGQIYIPNVSGASGVDLNATTPFTSNTDYGNFFGLTIIAQGGSNLAMTAINLHAIDSVHFYDVHVSNNAANTGLVCINFDYSVSNTFPSAVRFTGVDVGTCGNGTPVQNTGTPGAGAKPNWLMIDEANSMVCPVIANLACLGSHNIVTNQGGNVAGTDILGAWSSFTPSPTCGTATFTVNSARTKFIGKTVAIQADISFTALGTCTSSLTFTLPAAVNSVGNGAFAYLNNTALQFGFCKTLTTSTTAQCGPAGAANFAGTERLIFDAIYESQ